MTARHAAQLSTRRQFLVGAAGLLVPATYGCGGEPGAASEDASGGTCPFEHSAGVTDVPVRPQRIVTTTNQNALLPLLELGAKPVASAGLVEKDGAKTFRRVEGFDTSDIEFVGSYSQPNAEAVAPQDPDLIVGYEFDEPYYDELSRIAPTVLIQIFDRNLDDALLDFADLVGRTDRAEELRAGYAWQVDSLLDRLGDERDGLSVCVISSGDS